MKNKFMKHFAFFSFILFSWLNNFAQIAPFTIEIEPISINGLGGIQSFAFGQANGKWLIIGGRLDGLHKRQPNASFDLAGHNNQLIVVDPITLQKWTSPITSLSIELQEQLKSTNMQFHQRGDYLYLTGGYGYSSQLNDHTTFNKMIAIQISSTIDAIVNATALTPYFRQITDNQFQVTGGRLEKINHTFYLVGGHKFIGRYNPMNNPTYTQTYTNQVRKFNIFEDGTKLQITHLSAYSDPINLHRRDYNVTPQIYPDGSEGLTAFSGVFQPTVDLPYLNCVNIDSTNYTVNSNFSQYYNHYHCANFPTYSVQNNTMNTVFFGGIAQYYDSSGILVQDNNVPFVKTISRTTRLADGTLSEHNFPVEMPNLKGAGAEFIPNTNLSHYTNEVIKLNDITATEFVIGHLYGGIQSPMTNAFSTNQTNATSADPTIYEVKLVYNPSLNVAAIDGKNPFAFSVSPNPTNDDTVRIQFNLPYVATLDYFITSLDGKMLDDGEIEGLQVGKNTMNFSLENAKEKIVILTFILDNKFYASQKIIRNQ
jgi:hypothetical protein